MSLGELVVGSENIDMVACLFTYSYIFYSPWSSIGSNILRRSGGPSSGMIECDAVEFAFC